MLPSIDYLVFKSPQKDDNKSGDIEKLLKEELDDLNQKDKDLVVLDTNAKHTMFILSECADPNQVATSIFQVRITLTVNLFYYDNF